MAQRLSMMFIFFTLLFPGFSHADIQDDLLALLGTMSGQVYVEDQPAPFALVAFFDISKGLPPVGSGFARLPDFVGRADAEGNFQIKLMAGQYYSGILPRAENEPIGPPRPGEKFYFASDDHKRLRKVSVGESQVVDVGRLKGLRRPEILLEEDIGDFFTVEGKIVDGDTNKPYPGARVLAKKNPDHGKPDFFGAPTGSDGNFSIKLPVGTPLYLIAREGITGYKPDPGDKIGTYGVNSPAGVSSNTLSDEQKDTAVAGDKKKLDISNAEQGMAVTGTKGQVMSGLIIHMYEIPAHQENQENSSKQTGAMLDLYPKQQQ